MDMSQHPHGTEAAQAGAADETKTERGFLVFALVLISALAGAFALGGLAAMTMVMLAMVPVIYLTLVTIAWG